MSIRGPEASEKARFVDPVQLAALVTDLFKASGLEPQPAATAARILVDADLRGVWSHGVARVPMYRERVRKGVAKARPDIKVTRVAPAAAHNVLIQPLVDAGPAKVGPGLAQHPAAARAAFGRFIQQSDRHIEGAPAKVEDEQGLTGSNAGATRQTCRKRR